MTGTIVRTARLASLVVGIIGLATLSSLAQQAAQKDPWPELAATIFNNRPLADGAGLIAHRDAGTAPRTPRSVPMTSSRPRCRQGDTRRVKSLHRRDRRENPAPVAAIFNIGPNAVVSSISTRVRVNSYTNVHAVAELTDGKLYVVETYVESLGRLFGPGGQDRRQAGIGQMRLRQFAKSPDVAASNLREAQIMIRHPNNSGLQMDQITRHYLPAYFVQSLKIWHGEELLLTVDSSISISEDPNFRFTYLPSDAKSFAVEAIDTEKSYLQG